MNALPIHAVLDGGISCTLINQFRDRSPRTSYQSAMISLHRRTDFSILFKVLAQKRVPDRQPHAALLVAQRPLALLAPLGRQQRVPHDAVCCPRCSAAHPQPALLKSESLGLLLVAFYSALPCCHTLLHYSFKFLKLCMACSVQLPSCRCERCANDSPSFVRISYFDFAR